MENGCYVPQYYTASYKGVAFQAFDTSSEHGRRGAEGEFPFSENTAYTDLGRKIRRYNISGRFPQNEHIAAASALITAVETPGPGLLIHPTRGPVLAACVKLVVKDNPTEEMGYTDVELEFVEANQIATGFVLSGSLFGLDLTDFIAAIGSTFAEYYNLDSVRYYRVVDVQNTASEAMRAIRTEFQKAANRNPTTEKWQALATMRQVENDPSLIRSAIDAFDAFKRATRTLANATEGQSKYDSFKAIANAMAKTSSLPAEAGLAQNSVYQMTRLLAVVNMVQAALEIELSSLDLALDKYDEVVDIIEQEKSAARINCDDDIFISLRKLEADAKEALLTRAYKLPALVEYKFHMGTHSLVAAYEIFDDAKRFGELEALNSQNWPWVMGPSVIASRL